MKPPRIFVLFSTLALLMLLATSATTSLAGHTIPLGASGTDQSGECEGDYFKIEDAGVLEEGTHTYTGTTIDGVSFTAVLTVVFDEDDEVESITVVSTDPGYLSIVIKAGDDFEVEDGPVLSPGNGKAISNVAFCLETETTTTDETTDETSDETTDETTDETSDETTEETDDETTDETTDETSDETTDETSDETTDQTDDETTDETPDGSVEELTPPQTDALADPAGSQLVPTGLLLLLAAVLAAVMVVVPALARTRR